MPRPDEDGYTLAEMLVALIVIGLALGGLSQAVYIISHYQRAATETVGRSELIEDLSGDLRHTLDAAAGLDAVTGSAELLQVTTVGRPPDKLDLRDRRDGKALSFGYLATDGLHRTWPPAQPLQARLFGVGIFRTEVSDAAMPLAYQPVIQRQPVECQFDTIALACREPTP